MTLLEKAVNIITISGADIVTWGISKISNLGKQTINPANKLGVEKWQEMNIWGLYYPLLFLFASKRELWNNLEEFPDEIDLTDDVWLVPQVVSKTQNIVALNEVLYFYDCTNMNSISHNRTAQYLCRAGLAFYFTLKRNLKNNMKYNFPEGLKGIRRLLIDAYCVNCVNSRLDRKQINLIREALKDLERLFPQRKLNKFYFLQFCVIHGIDFYCRIYGNSRIKRFERELNE